MTLMQVAPFGGFKQSGLGREGSKYGMDEYLELGDCVELLIALLDVLGQWVWADTWDPRRMHCVMDSIPATAIEIGGVAPIQTDG
ncbi:hypothetical protein JHK85_006574 [Glycine max]|nr:hypothetical protein JHK87_006239 [Glycine soja]KAG5054064.1 hypothetical protein JHK85_006574 [Glycine max]KAG5071181.1 hypothetical protein JHK86_006392 [Glycine max]